MKKFLYIVVGFLSLAALIYFIGPTPNTPKYSLELPTVPTAFDELEEYIAHKESLVKLRKDNEAKIIWNYDSIKRQTEYVFLYIHGFSASHGEGNPVHVNVASHFNCNLYLARITGHGQDTIDALWNYTPESAWESAKEALVIAQQLGQKVIIVSTSTGGTLAIKLAAEYPNLVHALINLSPNIRIKDPLARIMNDPWGLQILRMVNSGNHRIVKHKEEEAPLYWDTIYQVGALVALEELMETTMLPEVFNKVTCPVLTLYYYKDVNHQDDIVDVSVIPGVHEQFSTPLGQNIYTPLSTQGDHVIGSSIKSKDYIAVQNEIIAFCEQVLEIRVPNTKSTTNTSLY